MDEWRFKKKVEGDGSGYILPIRGWQRSGFKLLRIAAVAAMVPAILARLLVVTLDAIETAPVAGPHNLTTLRTGCCSGWFRGAISGVEIGGEGGEHD